MEYFIKRTDERLEKIEAKIDKLLGYHWQIVGGGAVLSAIISVAIAMFFGR